MTVSIPEEDVIKVGSNNRIFLLSISTPLFPFQIVADPDDDDAIKVGSN
jgi:hypothetical protein